jgi:tRNA(fMet)-specific endonuclease VapC
MVGVEKSSAPRQVDRATRAVIGEFEVLPLTVAAAREYASLRASLESAGNVIGPNDMWIAAHALAEGMTLVSANEDVFRRVPGLKFENWARE